MTIEASVGGRRALTREERKVIIASSAGTVFEWYDFYLYGALAQIIGAQFFAAYSETQQSIFALLTFAAGFIVRPFGAIIFGRLGDIVGRKYTFVVTVVLMGAATFLVGLLPSYHTIGVAAPIALIVLRMLQGLATGGEYGGAAVYVAEHAPQNQRGFFTSWVNTTPTLALLLSLIVIMFTQIALDAGFPPVVQPDGSSLSAFKSWGWRIPFLLSAVLLLISLYVRLQMQESPAFQRMKAEGAASKAPLREAFGEWRNIKIGLIALFGLVAGQAVVWYTAHFYALFYIQNILQVDQFTTNVLVAWALIAGVGFVVVFASLSDRIGRKPLILGGCALAVAYLLPSVRTPDAHRKPGPLSRAEHVGSHRQSRSGRLLVPIQSDRERQVQHLVRHRQVRCWPSAPSTTRTRMRRRGPSPAYASARRIQSRPTRRIFRPSSRPA